MSKYGVAPTPGSAFVGTGASTGIGRVCALQLDKLGYRVFAGVRRPEDAENLTRASSGKLTPITLDITDSASIAAAASFVAKEVGDAGLAGLVNNAGIAVAAPLEFVPIDAFRKQIEVNLIGQLAVTQAFLPLLRKGQGRIVNIGSISGRVASPLIGPYSASKFALEALTAALRMELKPWRIHVAIIEPAGVATPIWSKALAMADELESRLSPQASELYGPFITARRKLAVRSQKNGLPPERVARDVIHALTAKRPRTRYIIGFTAWSGEISLRLSMPEWLREWIIIRRVKRL